MRVPVLLAIFLAAGVSVGAAQHSPYSGDTDREIKALSADEIEGYLGGHGMGFARVAELNHHPGPKHVLELAEALSLTAEQRTQTEAIFADMHRKATELGRRLVDTERELDRLFASGDANEADVRDLIARAGDLEAGLRFAHVEAHLKMKRALTPDQVARYDALRGYERHDGHGHN